MATGIVSRAVQLDGAGGLSTALFVVGAAAYVLLVAAGAWRLAACRRQVAEDLRDPRRAFGFFTLPAASNVLAATLGGDGHAVAAAILLTIGGITWAVLSYSVPLVLIAGGRSAVPPAAGANGAWFLWAVATQSVAVGLTALPPPLPSPLAALAAGFWAVGVVLYLIIAVLAAGTLLARPVLPAGLTPAWWVFMGATAISVLAGAQIMRLPADPLLAAVHPLLAGLSVVLWAFGVWLIPFLVIAGVWRHVLRKVPMAYEPGLWSIVFPAGMFGVASHQLGAVLRVSWLVTLGSYETWLALALWAVTAIAMAIHFMS
jgi:tellurite resistance protein TehA-like permease